MNYLIAFITIASLALIAGTFYPALKEKAAQAEASNRNAHSSKASVAELQANEEFREVISSLTLAVNRLTEAAELLSKKAEGSQIRTPVATMRQRDEAANTDTISTFVTSHLLTRVRSRFERDYENLLVAGHVKNLPAEPEDYIDKFIKQQSGFDRMTKLGAIPPLTKARFNG